MALVLWAVITYDVPIVHRNNIICFIEEIHPTALASKWYFLKVWLTNTSKKF